MYEVLFSLICTILIIAVVIGGYFLVKAFPIIGIIGFCVFMFCLIWFVLWLMVVG